LLVIRRLWLLAARLQLQDACLIEDMNELAHRTFERFGQSDEHREAWDLHSAFEVADERLVRFATISELLLSESARGAERAKMRAEDVTF